MSGSLPVVRRLIVLVVIVVCMTSASCAGLGDDSSPDFTLRKSATTTIRDDQDLMLPAYEPGDCVTWDQSISASDVEIVACDDPHLIELVASTTLPSAGSGSDEPYPTESEWVEILDRHCRSIVETFLGRPLQQGQFVLGGIRPQPVGWNAGDREIHCGVQQVGTDASGAQTSFVGRAGDLAVGFGFAASTCFPPAGEGWELTPTPCDDPHVFEVTGQFEVTELGTLPSLEEQRALFVPRCRDLAATHLGSAPTDDRVVWQPIQPDDWADGSRWVLCGVGQFDPNGALVPTVGSAKAG